MEAQVKNKNKTMKLFSIVLIATLTMCACRSTKKIQKAIVTKDSIAVVVNAPVATHADTVKMVNDVLNKSKQISYNTFSAKIKVDYFNSKGKQPDFVANIRLLKDSLIWISLSNDLGIEGIRVLITKDSIKVMDKLANTIQIRPLSSIQEISQIPFSLFDLQELLVGNPIFFNRDSISYYSKTANGYSLLSMGAVFKNLITINTNFQVEKSKLDDLDTKRNRTADITYYEYETKTGVLFSTYREMNLSQQTKLDVLLKFKDYKFNEEMSFPFTVPKKFKRIQ